MKVIVKMVKPMVIEFFIEKKGIDMKKNGKIIKNKEKELNIMKMIKQEKVIGKMMIFQEIDY